MQLVEGGRLETVSGSELDVPTDPQSEWGSIKEIDMSVCFPGRRKLHEYTCAVLYEYRPAGAGLEIEVILRCFPKRSMPCKSTRYAVLIGPTDV